MLTSNGSSSGSVTKKWILHRVLQWVAMNRHQRDPSKSTSHADLHYKLVSCVVPDFSYRGEVAGEMFVHKLQEDVDQLFPEYIDTPRQLLALSGQNCIHSTLTSTVTYAISHWEGTTCMIIVTLWGNYRGAAHRCNLAYRISKSDWKLPVVIHNLRGYDWHLIAKTLKSEFGEGRVIPPNMEKYLSITVYRLKFIDSLQFTSQSLGSLVKTLEVDEFKYLWEAFPIAHEFELIKWKRVYTYDYMNSFTRFDESRLPLQDAFFSKLSDSLCLDMEYAHATQVWTAFECESMADYHDI